MTHRISDHLLAQCSEFITVRFGLHFPRKRWRDLERGIVCAAREFGLEDAAACADWLISAELTRSQLGILAGCLTIGETYFFRERSSFEALETEILPGLLNSRRGREQRLRIWSAGCATGEEPYSIAMLLQKMIADLPKWNVTILATDVNTGFLRKAERGVYGDWSFRGVPPRIKAHYFTKTPEGKYEIAAAIRKMVTFAPLNLAEDPYPSLVNNTNALDLIFCRNVLMYFAPRQMKEVIGNFRQSLIAGGWLAVSPSEASHTLFTGFETVSFPNAVFYRKDGHDTAAALHQEAAAGKAVSPSLFTGTEHDAAPRFIPLALPVPSFPVLVAEPDHAVPEVSPYEEAKGLYRQGLFTDATLRLTEFLATGPGETSPSACYGKAAVLLARIFANQGNFAASLEWAERAIAADKLDPEAHYLQALIYQEQGADDAAAASLKRALYLDQTFVLAHFALANLALRRGRAQEAARHLENAAVLLKAYGDDDILPGSEGLSARRFAEIVGSTRGSIVKSRD